MAVDSKELANYVEKEVLLHTEEDDGSIKEMTGVVKAADENIGLVFKEKGQREVVLIAANRVFAIDALPEKPKEIKSKRLKIFEADTIKQHLADRHAISLIWLNSASDEDALTYHNTLDHSDLGHHHANVEKKEAETSESASDATPVDTEQTAA